MRVREAIGWLILFAIAFFAVWTTAAPYTMEPLLVTGQTGVDPGQARIVVNNVQGKSQTFWCNSSPAYQRLCKTLFDMNALNIVGVDVAFINNNVYLYDEKGRQVAPRP